MVKVLKSIGRYFVAVYESWEEAVYLAGSRTPEEAKRRMEAFAAMKEARAKRVHWADCDQRGW